MARQAQELDARWKWPLFALWALAAVFLVSEAIDNLGFAARPWYGWWDSYRVPSGEPYVVTFQQPRHGGATERAGIRAGDRGDTREQTWRGPVTLLTQPSTIDPTLLVLHRGSAQFTAGVVGSTVWDGEPLLKLLATLPTIISGLCFLVCALLIVVRRSSLREGRILAIVLLALVPGFIFNSLFTVPDPTAVMLLWALGDACRVVALALVVHLASSFGARPIWRRVLEGFAYAVIAVDAVRHFTFYYAIATLRIDPVAYWSGSVGGVTFGDIIAAAVVATAAGAAVALTESARSRAAWLLLPLPIALTGGALLGYPAPYASTWVASTALEVVAGAVVLMGAFLVTYALLRRRVLDLGFVLSRAFVVAIVSLIVVMAFVLLEYLLGTALTGVSHATGLIANGALALVLGVSLRFIHKRVDDFVDAVMFRKRREDERALLDFAKEAAFVTESGALLDRTIETIERHTDAQGATVLLHANGSYTLARSFGDGCSRQVDENDSAILALKTWHQSLDPHRYSTALHGALALPMLARGRLLGVLLLGERSSGEAYAPDEIEALSALAHGAGSSLDALSINKQDSRAAIADEIRTQLEPIRAQLDAISQRLGRGDASH